jgi:dynein heavy chain
VAADKKVADEKEKVVSEEAKIVGVKKAEAEMIAEDAKRDLKAAEPELQAAQKAVSNLDKSSIVEIKSMSSPPKGVVMVMESVMILMQERTEWPAIKSSLADVGKFIKILMNFDLKQCPDKAFNKVRKEYLARPEFDPELVKKQSLAASSIAIWVRAVNNYSNVMRIVEPKQAKYNEVKRILDAAVSDLNEKMAMLKKVKDDVAALEKSCEDM